MFVIVVNDSWCYRLLLILAGMNPPRVRWQGDRQSRVGVGLAWSCGLAEDVEGSGGVA